MLTARADFSLTQAPWHVEDTVWGNGYAWNTLGDDGKYYPRLAQVTTKAVFVLWTLWETEYTDAGGGGGEENGFLQDRRVAGGINDQRGGKLPLRQLFRERLVSVIERQIGAVFPGHLQTFGNAIHDDHLLNAIYPL